MTFQKQLWYTYTKYSDLPKHKTFKFISFLLLFVCEDSNNGRLKALFKKLKITKYITGCFILKLEVIYIINMHEQILDRQHFKVMYKHKREVLFNSYYLLYTYAGM